MSRRRNKHYSKELKLQAVQDYLSGGGSYETLRKKYGLLSTKQLRNWVKWYNGHKEIKEGRGAVREIYMTKGRKTTQAERAEIVAFCIEHGRDYPLTIQTYGVSYQQIYSWVRKYEEKGVDGLADGRGRTKPESEMNEIEKLRAQNKILQAQIKDKEMEIALLKKLSELEGWDV
jgi:transposase-like protein